MKAIIIAAVMAVFLCPAFAKAQPIGLACYPVDGFASRLQIDGYEVHSSLMNDAGEVFHVFKTLTGRWILTLNIEDKLCPIMSGRKWLDGRPA